MSGASVGATVRRAALRRWTLVAVVAALLVATPAVVAAWPASDPGTDPAVLRDRVAASPDRPWSGYAESSAGTGLPRIPVLSDVTSLLTGTTRRGAWSAAPDRARTDLISVSGERDRYLTPDGQVVWDYGANLVTLVEDDPEVRLPRPDDLLPPQLARRLLAGTAPDDPATPLPAQRVAGVDAAGLRITPADPSTTVAALDIWADPGTGLPVQVDVTTRSGGPPVLSTRFLELEQGPPDPAALVPQRGPGAGLTRSPTSDLFGVLGRGPGRGLPASLDGRPREQPQPGFAALGQYGTSLSQVVVVTLPPQLSGSLFSGLQRAGSATRTLDVPADGQGAVLQSSLLNLAVVRSSDGRRSWALSGLVDPAVLERGAADLLEGSRR